ncbi:MAG: tetratricopeptide repeat protein [Candidatus Omnitrophica bacterium]|nr:tetratricopeptide repeat protein [Candidatus Omnitrophota bacterium]
MKKTSVGLRKIFLSITVFLIIFLTSSVYYQTHSYTTSISKAEHFMNHGEYLKALPWLLDAYHRQPSDMFVILSLIEVYEDMDKENDLNDFLNKIWTNKIIYKVIKPTDFRALGYAYYRTSKYDEAEKFLTTYLKIDNDRGVSLSLAEIYAWQNKYDEAKDILLAVIRQDQSDFQSREFLADIYQWNNEYGLAAEMYAQVVSQKPENEKVVFKLAEALRYSGKDRQAIEVYENYLQKKTN